MTLEGLAQYAGALEAIIRSLPGGPVVNGRRMSNEEGIADLRRRFDIDGDFVDEATLAANIVATVKAAR
jgi:hypothetical protein